ncbi:DUF2264 domain-containing protein [Bacteroides sp. 51]|uniref:DUF2264 domain-containing protein n=1 Tax=Bacteroides sp. 51 TaxID=2302938 RepID=UPI0013D070CE|nr:DUF2264 domain-containing protein [Bacteroides sp. 51]NDV81789.1 DUF2264 domain-containing protein [Bacteroides sp. 51]
MINRKVNGSIAIAIIFFSILLQACTGKSITESNTNVFVVNNPNHEVSPLTGMTRRHWMDAATYLLDGAFSYIDSLDSPMKFPKQLDKVYPKNDGQIPTEKLEGLCRTLFVAAPLLRENPDLELNGIKVADYYRHQILNLINPESPGFIKHRPENGGPSQNLVEFGALAISLSIIPEVIWEPFTQEQKDALAATMISYGDGPTVDSNWKFFNIFVLSFFKDQGYTINEELLIKYVTEALAFYRGQGWYNDSPAYDYYSMWAFQMYGPVWAQLYGNKYYPEYARQFMSNLRDLADNYPYMFNKEGQMNMWGRSICYRFGSVVPFAMLGFLEDSSINYGWMRRIASSTMLQFLKNPDFLEDNVPSLGFYGPFAPAVQIYSCRGSVYWAGKVFMALLLPEDNVFWTAKENNGAWEEELKPGNVYNKFQEGSNLLITDYPNCGGAEMRSWCHETVAGDWQLFRSTENYNKLAYHTEFPWMADGQNGEISMNYGVLNGKKEWEVLRLYTFRSFEDGVYRRDAVLETNTEITFKLADIPLPSGVLRVDKMITPVETDVRLGHYSLPQVNDMITETNIKVNGTEARIINNGAYQLAMIPLQGWGGMETVRPAGLHPVSDICAVTMATDRIPVGERVYVTLQLWKKGNEVFTAEELNPVKSVEVIENGDVVEVVLQDGEKKRVVF